jgi:predicted nucleic acid-binding protein
MSKIYSQINKTVIIDSGFWFALYDKSEVERHRKAISIFDKIKETKIIIPWPTLYEILKTRFTKNRISMIQFELFLKKGNVIRLNDEVYKEDSLVDTFQKSLDHNRPISLVDVVIRNIISDEKNKIDYLVTFNEKDFVDIIKKRKIKFFYNGS